MANGCLDSNYKIQQCFQGFIDLACILDKILFIFKMTGKGVKAIISNGNSATWNLGSPQKGIV